MKIAIEANLCSAQEQATGLGVYTDQLLKALSSIIAPEDHIYLLHAQKQWQGYDYGKQFEPVSYSAGSSQFVSIAFNLNKVLKKINPDVFHVTCNAGAPPISSVPTVTTVHDLFALSVQGVPLKTRLLMKLLFSWTFKNSSFIISDSEYMKQSLISKGIDGNKIQTIYLGTQMEFPAESLQNKQIEQPYFLCVGALEPRKGQVMLAQAYLSALQINPHIPDLYFIGSDRGDGQKIQKLSEQSQKLKWLNFVSRDELISYYQNAEAFIFPSYDEGFGIPVLEAMKAGLNVICSDIPVLREIAGFGAYFVKPEISDFREALLKYAAGELTFPDSASLKSHLARFNWQETARQTMQIYRKAAKK